jgi:hypothetical protein
MRGLQRRFECAPMPLSLGKRKGGALFQQSERRGVVKSKLPPLPTPVRPDGKTQFTQKQIAELRGVSLRTVIRDIRRYNGRPLTFIGQQPVFTAEEYARMETLRIRERSKRSRFTFDDRDGGEGMISVAALRKEKRRVNGQRRNGKARR